MPGDGRALVGDQRGQVPVDLAVFQAQPSHPSGVLGPEPEAPKADDQAESGEVLLGVLAVTIGLSGGGRDDAGRLVPANRRGGDAGALGELGDHHAGTSASL